MRYRILSILVLLIGIVLSACTSGNNDTDVEEVGNPTDHIEILVVADAQPNDEATTAGELELTITFENSSDNEVTLDLTQEDYHLQADGIDLTPITISEDLVNPTIPPNGSISGTADYTVESAVASYVLSVSGFETITVDADVDTTTE